MKFTKVKDSVAGFCKERLPKFVDNNFELNYTKASRITGAALCAVLLIVVIFDVNAFTTQKFSSKWVLLAFALCCPFIIGLFTAFRIKIKNVIADQVWHVVLIFLLPFLTISMTECLNDVFIYNMTYLGFLGNYMVVLIMYFIAFAASGSYKIAVLTVNPILFGLAVAHSYIMDFRGTPFLPMDFLSITTAAGVANTYNYTLTYKVMTAILIFVFIIVLGIKIKTPNYITIVKVVIRTFMATFAGVLLILFYFTSIFADAGIKPDFWNQARGYHNYGFVFNFFCNTKYLYMSEPNGYDPDKVDEFVSNVVKDDSDNSKPDVSVGENTPNIICIMNESLSDLKVMGNLTTNEDYMPFIHGLQENTIKGNLYVPVIGAGTSNTEFEFLTGHTTAFLPSGSNAYMLYIKDPLASLVSTLKGQGYSSYALHPYYAAGWNRTNVYKYLGFNKFVSLENIIDISLMNEYQENGSNADYLQKLIDERYPGSNMLLRQYISDSYDFRYLKSDFENRDKSVPYFAFNVTMQNHGGYTTSASNFNESIFATSTSQNYNKANKYLSLVKASDDAFKELVDYFSTVSEPTIICMFGDHQPSVETSFISEVIGVNSLSDLTLEQEQSRHITPFIIWANYNIGNQNIDKLSSNYLSSLVLKTAGVNLTEYNKYLLKLSETLPVIDTVGYIDNENNYYKWSDISPYSDMLSEYEKIQYNNIFDKKNKKTDIFYLNGYNLENQTDSSESGETK